MAAATHVVQLHGLRLHGRRAPSASGEAGAPAGCQYPGPDALQQGGRRLGWVRRVGELGQRSGVLVQGTLAARTAGQVGSEELLVLGLEGVQGVAGRELVESHVLVGPGHGALPWSGDCWPAAAFDIPSRDSFIRRMPASIRVLTVPRGVLVSPAISRCV